MEARRAPGRPRERRRRRARRARYGADATANYINHSWAFPGARPARTWRHYPWPAPERPDSCHRLRSAAARSRRPLFARSETMSARGRRRISYLSARQASWRRLRRQAGALGPRAAHSHAPAGPENNCPVARGRGRQTARLGALAPAGLGKTPAQVDHTRRALDRGAREWRGRRQPARRPQAGPDSASRNANEAAGSGPLCWTQIASSPTFRTCAPIWWPREANGRRAWRAWRAATRGSVRRDKIA